MQTESYLEELSDKMPEVENTTQTDPLLDRPPEPLFMPAKSGVDVETQVDVDELFDFDLEVEPILEVLVGKTIEHAMLEVSFRCRDISYYRTVACVLGNGRGRARGDTGTPSRVRTGAQH